jgi:hypothetical protein
MTKDGKIGGEIVGKTNHRKMKKTFERVGDDQKIGIPKV